MTPPPLLPPSVLNRVFSIFGLYILLTWKIETIIIDTDFDVFKIMHYNGGTVILNPGVDVVAAKKFDSFCI